MALSIFCLIEVCILLLNSLAVLNPRYFLSKCKPYTDGLDSLDKIDGYSNPMKKQLAFLLYAARTYGRSNSYVVPLIFANSAIIILEILIG